MCHFQLPLSGSPFHSGSTHSIPHPSLSTPSLGITAIELLQTFGSVNFQLPLSGSRAQVIHEVDRIRREAFNSLSRDHLGSSAGHGHADRGKLSTPSLGITRRRKSALPNRYSHDPLSTPSLGITDELTEEEYRQRAVSFNSLSRDHGNREKNPRRIGHFRPSFQLPLSGSPPRLLFLSRRVIQDLSTPSLGITSHFFIQEFVAGTRLLSTPSLGITGEGA